MHLSPSRLGHEAVWAESKCAATILCSDTDFEPSLAWMELTTVIAKLLLTYDMELLNQELDWHRDSRMATLWQKPELRVKVTTRSQKGLRH